MSDASASDENRRATRSCLFLMALCQLPDRHQEDRVKVRNLSASGLMAEGALQPVPGENVVIELRNVGPVIGSVAWVHGNRFGVAFANTICPEDVRQAGTFTPGPDPDPRTYYQRGPVGVITRQAEVRKDRLRSI